MSNSTDVDVSLSFDSMWILVSGFLVFFMQAGFAMLEVGTVRSKNAQNILFKNMLDVAIGTILWWLVGYGFAYGDSKGEFIGGSAFAGHKYDAIDNSYRDWFFQWAFASTAATILSGALAERTKFLAYALFSSILTGFIYPMVVHWTWGGGWLGKGGYLDFAGSGIVHMVGGISALVGAYVVGPRLGRFNVNNEDEFKPHNMPLVVLGTFVLWFGWYGFNAGSTLGFTGSNVVSAAVVSMNTSLAAASGGLTVMLFRALLSKFRPNRHMFYDVVSLANGILAGLVSVTAPCGSITPECAFVIGIIGGFVYVGFSIMVLKLKIDDPLDAFAVHGGAGLWGVISVGFFDTTGGVFYGGGGTLLGWQLIGAVVITAWSAFWSFAVFLSLKKLNQLRIPEKEEICGMDAFEHGGDAYHIEHHNVNECDDGEQKSAVAIVPVESVKEDRNDENDENGGKDEE